MIVNGLHNNHIKMTKPVLQNRKSVVLAIIVVVLVTSSCSIEIDPGGLLLYLNL